MNEIDGQQNAYKQLQVATKIVLLFQVVFMFSQLFDDVPGTGNMFGLLAATLVLYSVNLKLGSEHQNRHASVYVIAWRIAALAFVGVLSGVIAVRAYLPEATPSGLPHVIAMMLAAVIALKGALLGKLRPNRVLGLRLRWTCQSRLAWDKAHRLMGRILFGGGVIALIAAPFAPVIATFIVIGSVVVVGVASGAITSWRVWRTDPERQAG